MFASRRMSASHPWMMSSNVFDRWLISRIDIPTPGSDTRSRCACSSTSTGRTAGPAEKLKIRVVVVIAVSLYRSSGVQEISQRYKLQVQHGAVLALDLLAQRGDRLAVEVD